MLGDALRGVDVDELLGTACVAQGLLLSTYNGPCLRPFAWVPPMPSRLRARSPARPLPIGRDRCPGRIQRLTAHSGWVGGLGQLSATAQCALLSQQRLTRHSHAQKRCVAGSTASRRLVGAEEKYVSHVLASRVSSVLLTRHLGGTSSLSRNLEASNGTDNGRECSVW